MSTDLIDPPAPSDAVADGGDAAPAGSSAPPPKPIRAVVAVVRFAIPLVVLGTAVLVAVSLLASRPEAARTTVEDRPTLVETFVPVVEDTVAEIVAYGTVEPHRELVLQPQVGGQVVRLNENLRPGGRLAAGEMLFEIDPRDYELAVTQREAEVANAAVALQLEEARGAVAQREWELLGDSIETSEIGERLALREPQRIEKEAALAAARGRLEQAELDLERTVVVAPFNGLVLSDDVEIGQVVSPQTRAAMIAGSDRFDVVVSVPLEKLPWIRADPADPAGNSPALVIQELGDGRTVRRTGRVDRIVGEVERAGRLAKVRILVDDPLASTSEPTDPGTADVPLLLGSYVRVEIGGPRLEQVMELPRAVVRANDTVWIMGDDRRLDIRPVAIRVGRPDTVVVDAMLEPGEEIVSSPLPAAIPGMPLERIAPAGRPGENVEAGGGTGS
ncbi:MAG: efflux RND transporter periplasmic adaptor subunit [Planctomycetota bacterium]|nr:efflux RND transporter periplasmic adaptor subunit [Planctomycetota bacterium]